MLWGPPDRHYNHSCYPNAYEAHEGDGSETVYLVALRAVAEGEEITLDYAVNTSGGSTWPCRCGAARCRGETVGNFFLLPNGPAARVSAAPSGPVRRPPP